MTGMTDEGNAQHTDRLAAEQLGMSPEEVRRLRSELSTIQNRAQVDLTSPLLVYPDPGARPWWEVRVAGTLTDLGGLVIEFDFTLVIYGTQLLWGTSQVADRYTITAADGRVLYEGQIECPDERADDNPDRWAGYDVFGPVRSVAVDTMTALLVTGRLERREVTGSGEVAGSE